MVRCASIDRACVTAIMQVVVGPTLLRMASDSAARRTPCFSGDAKHRVVCGTMMSRSPLPERPMKQIYLIPVCLLLAAGCSDSLASGSQGAPRNRSMTFGSASSSSTAPSARIVGSQPGAFADVSASDRTNALVITKAQLVLSEQELKKIETAVCDDEHADGSSSDDS